MIHVYRFLTNESLGVLGLGGQHSTHLIHQESEGPYGLAGPGGRGCQSASGGRGSNRGRLLGLRPDGGAALPLGKEHKGETEAGPTVTPELQLALVRTAAPQPCLGLFLREARLAEKKSLFFSLDRFDPR
ncbi:hypothetical protein HJG60_010385 [Phyllostomus discolor]|uniref:Uncharacterized protein n=1 Tax=Phyllostomus discolor TaxID=89673 RepID=A0A834B005_9CHIR|nr:hypothetical protein HJG60_010385 [Phyllostomus discolor]